MSTVYATDATCTHALAWLSEGCVIDGDLIECPLHQGCFPAPSGKAMGAPATQDLPTSPVKVVGSDLFSELLNE